MYFAISKINFEIDTQTATDGRDLKALAEKIRSRFKVCAITCNAPEFSGEAAIAIATLGGTEQKVTAQLDSIATFCEESGFGRIDYETTLIDHLSSLAEGEEME